MPNLGFTEIMLIMVVVLLLFGAKRLPEVGASIGKGIREFKRSLSDTQDAIMGGDESQQRANLPPRHVDASAPPANAPSGEPKRLSQYGGRADSRAGHAPWSMPRFRFTRADG